MDQRSLLKQFSDQTGCNDTDSRQYLNDSDWDVDLAVAMYMSTRPKSNMNNVPSLFPTRPAVLNPDPPKPKPAPAARRTGIAGLSDYNSREPEEEDDKKQRWYTGGGKSGMEVEAPRKSEDVKNSVFDNAKKMGARDGASENNSFAGQAYKLGAPVTKAEAPQQKEYVLLFGRTVSA